VGATETTFDGVNDYVNLGNVLSFTTQMSAFVWVKTTTISNSHIISKYNHIVDKREWLLGTDDGKLRVIVTSGGLIATSKYYDTVSAFNDDIWHSLGFTWTNGVLKLYIDGVEQNVLKNYDYSFTDIYNSDVNTNLGMSGANTHYFDGSISNAKIWNRALSAEEIATLYSKGRN